ncbi:acetate kinase [Sulfuricurvum sp.]|uniref:acetate/propionate family kinase n=1 Tax=Sulfuricurvum sp. TaxID=2025608 RepID=UPI00262EB5BE|nr:acetate kinase [Sulfuricurvum sp.]MDD4884372.1 acetate kinase [Sulfuricurvum sp.]
MSILVINAGSSSIKYTLYKAITLTPITHGLIEEITDHHAGFLLLEEQLRLHGYDFSSIEAIGHRVVHGGEHFNAPALIDDDVLYEIVSFSVLAPLHNPANLDGIYAARQIAPHVPHIAVFDTAFHQSMPPYAYRYPLPNKLYTDDKVRRYGFHGTSYRYVSAQAALLLDRPLQTLNLIAFHIGNGVSACAISGGKSIDTTMGMTPLDGLMMGSRCGAIDPSIIGYLMHEHHMSIDAVDALMNKQSGLLGIAGESDMRRLIERTRARDENAILAVEMFAYRLKKQLGAFMATMQGVNAIIFTGGIGEHAADIRTLVCQDLEHLGIVIDPEKNNAGVQAIHHTDSRVALLVIPTNEELQIAIDVQQLLNLHP